MDYIKLARAAERFDEKHKIGRWSSAACVAWLAGVKAEYVPTVACSVEKTVRKRRRAL